MEIYEKYIFFEKQHNVPVICVGQMTGLLLSSEKIVIYFVGKFDALNIILLLDSYTNIM